MPQLIWNQKETYFEAQLGTKEDGVLFTHQIMLSCHRRGPHRLLIEVCGGENHRKWGCFDDQDQPMRYYHDKNCLYREAQCIADVLWEGRYGRTIPNNI